MHYKNGRPAAIGDWVVGISHNSEHQTVCGYVVNLMPEQGTCNIKILRWREESYTDQIEDDAEEIRNAVDDI
jgi:hypothetical protein